MCLVEEVIVRMANWTDLASGTIRRNVGGRRSVVSLFLLGGNGWKWQNAARGDVRLMRMSDLVGCRSLEESTRAIR